METTTFNKPSSMSTDHLFVPSSKAVRVLCKERTLSGNLIVIGYHLMWLYTVVCWRARNTREHASLKKEVILMTSLKTRSLSDLKTHIRRVPDGEFFDN